VYIMLPHHKTGRVLVVVVVVVVVVVNIDEICFFPGAKPVFVLQNF